MALRDGVAEQDIEPPVTAVPARWAVTAVFFLNGLLLSSYIIRLPSLKADHHLNDGQLGLLATLFGAAAVITMQFVGSVVAQVGSARIIRIALVVMPIMLVGIGLPAGIIEFAVAVFLMGAVHGTLDVAMNAHAVAVERLRQRPVMSGCHAAWSISAILASLLAAALIRAGVTTTANFLIVSGIVLVAGFAVSPLLLPASVDRRSEPRSTTTTPGWRTGWTRTVIRLGLTGFALMICDGAVLTWSVIFLHDNRGNALAAASLAVTAYTAFQTLGRLTGDRLKVRYGEGTLFRVGGAIGTVGFAVAVLGPWLWISIVGFAILGLGTSVLIPLTFSAAGHAGGSGPGAAAVVARFATLAYAGILLGPALIGWIAQGIGLPWTLAALIPLLGIVAAAGLRTGPGPVDADVETRLPESS
jgi:MFS family permease